LHFNPVQALARVRVLGAKLVAAFDFLLIVYCAAGVSIAACAASRYASTLCPITINSARAVRVGFLRPCSQLRSVPTLTPHMLANVS
jgi:hypothetical protein